MGSLYPTFFGFTPLLFSPLRQRAHTPWPSRRRHRARTRRLWERAGLQGPKKGSKKLDKAAAAAGDAGEPGDGDAVIASLQAQVKDLQKQLRETKAELERKVHDLGNFDQQLGAAREQAANHTRLSAKRLIQIAAVEAELEKERARSTELSAELVKQTKMMDLVLNFRDQESGRDVAELTNQNIELRDQLEVWRERAQTLQEERWSFVARFRRGEVSADDVVKVDGVAPGGDDDSDDDGGGSGGGAADDDDDDW